MYEGVGLNLEWMRAVGRERFLQESAYLWPNHKQHREIAVAAWVSLMQ